MIPECKCPSHQGNIQHRRSSKTSEWFMIPSNNLCCQFVYFVWFGCLTVFFPNQPPSHLWKKLTWQQKLHRTTKARMNADWKVGKAQYAEFNVPTCGKIAVWQLCREWQPLWHSHDGLNLTCLDQCHRVRSHGKSSSQSWRKRIVIQQSEFSL